MAAVMPEPQLVMMGARRSTPFSAKSFCSAASSFKRAVGVEQRALMQIDRAGHVTGFAGRGAVLFRRR